VASYRAMTHQAGVPTQIQDANDIVVGSGIKTNTGDLVLTASSGKVGVGISAPKSTLDVNGAIAGKVTSVSADYAAASEFVILVTTGATGRTITLPAAANVPGRMYLIKKVDSGAGTVTIDANAAELIDGATTVVMTLINQAKVIISDGAAWNIFSSIV